jgi:hypothetical protein
MATQCKDQSGHHALKLSGSRCGREHRQIFSGSRFHLCALVERMFLQIFLDPVSTKTYGTPYRERHFMQFESNLFAYAGSAVLNELRFSPYRNFVSCRGIGSAITKMRT